MNLLAQAPEGYIEVGTPSTGMQAILVIVYLAVIVFMIAAMWKVFTKAGEPGWASIVPIYNVIVYLKIAGRPWWWLFIFIIPFVGLVIAIIAAIDFAKAFGKGGGFAVGLIFLPFIFIPILAWGDARYVGPGGAPAAA